MLVKLLHYFIYTFVVIYLVQRKNVKSFDIQQTAIQSAMLSTAFIIVELLLSLYTKAIEKFELDLNDSMYSCDLTEKSNNINCVKSLPSINKSARVIKPVQVKNPKRKTQIYTQFDNNDINTSFDKIVKDPPKFDQCKPIDDMTNNLQNNSGQSYENSSEHYNTLQPGYTYMNPKRFRTPEMQPPICLTDQPCATQPVVLSTSLGREFLPYSKVKSSDSLDNIKESSDKHCMVGDTVFSI
jgi:hypothetical protein